MSPGRLAVVDEEAGRDHEEAGQRSDRQIDAADHERDCLTEGDEAEGGGGDHERGDIERIR